MKWLLTLVVGVVLGALGVIYGLNKIELDPLAPATVAPASTAATNPSLNPGVASATVPAPVAPPLVAEPAATALPAASADAVVAPINTAPLPVPVAAQAQSLGMPVAGISASQLSDTYGQSRGSERQHEALDILAARGTEVKAVADGKLVKLFTSKPGGLTVYQFDAREKYSYYYAHLDRYAPQLKEGQQIKQGDLIGYVGSTGNADPAAPHLHFAIFELYAEKQWWKGTPLNPYPYLRGEQNLP